jgi:cyclopropane-fatty-acyl-phospholipid synthase
LELLSAAASGVAVTSSNVLILADLGCAQGHNSLTPMAAAIKALRSRTNLDIDVVHTDLPGNDWSSLFDVIEHDPMSYFAGHPQDIHPSVIGRSFYQGLFAGSTVSLAWTSSALHWLSESPGPIADHFFVQSSTDHAAMGSYRTRAAADWQQFLGHRSVELVPNGSVVFVDVLMGDDDVMGAESLFDALEQSLLDAQKAGLIAQEEYENLTYPTWFRTLDELRAPFTPSFVGPSGATLDLMTLEPLSLPDPFLLEYGRSGDAEKYGRQQSEFLRGFLEPSFDTALTNHDDRQAILDRVFAQTAARIAIDPDAMSPTYRLVTGEVCRTT